MTRYGYSRRTSAYRERWYSYIDWALVAMVAGTVLALGVLAWIIVISVQGQARWDDWCMEQGGRVDSSTSHGYGWTTVNGKQTYAPVTTTTRYCLTDDGRILDIY